MLDNIFLISVGWGYRHIQVLLLFFGLLVAYALRVNISVGIVAMVDKSPNSTHTVSQFLPNQHYFHNFMGTSSKYQLNWYEKK